MDGRMDPAQVPFSSRSNISLAWDGGGGPCGADLKQAGRSIQLSSSLPCSGDLWPPSGLEISFKEGAAWNSLAPFHVHRVPFSWVSRLLKYFG